MSPPRTLLIGGTGPTGPHLLNGLLDRGHDVTIFHTGRHEVDGMPEVPHRHGDPFSADGIAAALGEDRWDVVIATYGRVRMLAEHVAGRCDRFLFVGGTPVYRGMVHPEQLDPPGMRTPVAEGHPRVDREDPPGARYGVAAIRRVEDAVFGLHDEGAFAATVFRYPTLYGPRNPHPWEWTIVGRVLDGRDFVFVPDDGRGTHSRAGHRNAAHALLLGIDHPDAAAGKAYNVADDEVVSIRQWAEIVAALTAERLGHDQRLEVRALPGEVPQPGWGMIAFGYQGTPNCIVDTTAIRRDLGYTDVQSLTDGLADVVDAMLADPEAVRANPNHVDPFDYATEDRIAQRWDAVLAELRSIAAPIREGLTGMPLPQAAATATSANPDGRNRGAPTGDAAAVDDDAAVIGAAAVPGAVRAYFEAMNTESYDLLDDAMTADVTVTYPGLGTVTGRDDAKARYASLLAGYPEHLDRTTRFLVAGDTVTVEIQFEGRSTEGAELRFRAVDVFDLDPDGRIARVQICFDSREVLRQLRGI